MVKILIADDNLAVRNFLRGLLAHQPGWVVCGEASDGRQAIVLAAQQQPDIILLDLSMPGVNGLEAAKEILRNTPSVPIVIFTLHDSPELAREAAKAGVRRVISKVLSSSTLISEIEKLVGPADVPVGPLGLSPAAPPSLTTNTPAPSPAVSLPLGEIQPVDTPEPNASTDKSQTNPPENTSGSA